MSGGAHRKRPMPPRYVISYIVYVYSTVGPQIKTRFVYGIIDDVTQKEGLS
jgi:hypothetical protein